MLDKSKEDALRYSSKKGFTLIELIVVMGIIAILAAIVIVAVNPARQLAQSRNSRRISATEELRKGVEQYIANNNGALPSGVSNQVKKIGTTVASDYVNLSTSLVPTYLSNIPTDPETGSAADTGFRIAVDTNNRPVIFAPDAELGVTISSGEVSNLALNFDGVDDSATFPTANISTTTGTSVSLWMFPSSFNAVNSIVNVGPQSSAAGFHWLYLNSSTSLRWQYANGTAAQTIIGSYTFSPNQWYHVALTHDYTAKNIRMYVNGVQVSTQTHVDNVVPVASKNMVIGRYNGTTNTFPGAFDEVQVYSRVLTPAEVTAAAASPAGSTSTTGLLAGYHFGEGAGTSANDYSPNNRDLTISGATWTIH
jgi:type IV pilus assembly protein PilA